MSKAYVIGVGMTDFGRFAHLSAESLGVKAATSALRDAEISWDQVNEVYCAHVNQGVAAGQRLMRDLGPTGIPVMNIENCSAAGSTAVRQAAIALRSGQADVIVVVGFEKMQHGLLLNIQQDDDPDVVAGLAVLPMRFSLMAMEHAAKYGTTTRAFANIAVKNRKHAGKNPKAQYRNPVTVEEVLGSKMISDPITTLQCSPTTDGGAALVLASERFVNKHGATRAVEVVSSALTSDRLELGWNLYNLEHLERASKELYERTSIGPDDLDVIETHDCFTVAEVLAYEAIGLCGEGEGGAMAEDGSTTIGGRIPVNPSGGLLAKGHPLGASGVAQIGEIVTQLRGEADQRQVEGARIGMTANMGMWSCCVTMLSS